MQRKDINREGKNEKIYDDLLYLITCAVNATEVSREQLIQMDLSAVFDCSKEHSLTSIVFLAVREHAQSMDRQLYKMWQEEYHKALVKNLLFDADREALCGYCEENEIWYMPLKGVILKELYPAPEMRQMSDNDILFDEKYRKSIRDWFTSRNYSVELYEVGNVDEYVKEPVLNFEMHVSLFDESSVGKVANYYHSSERLLRQKEPSSYLRYLSDEDLYVYLVAHEYKHFSHSGTGLRSLLDCYVYQKAKKEHMDWNYIEKQWEAMEILEFGRITSSLSWKLFSEKAGVPELSNQEQETLSYFLQSGTYGTLTNRVTNILKRLSEENTGKITLLTKLTYLWSRLFPGKKHMQAWCKVFAPALIKNPLLFPLAYVWRWIYRGKGNRSELSELMKVKNVRKR